MLSPGERRAGLIELVPLLDLVGDEIPDEGGENTARRDDDCPSTAACQTAAAAGRLDDERTSLLQQQVHRAIRLYHGAEPKTPFEQTSVVAPADGGTAS